MDTRTSTSDPVRLYDTHELVKVSDSSFSSLPLFLPSNVTYHPDKNTVTTNDDKENVGFSAATGDKGQKEDLGTSALNASPALVMVQNAGWDMLKALEVPVSVISCVGPYRTGKSLLMSRFLQTSNAFEIGPTLEGCTRGIWISTSALKDPTTGCLKFFLDAEGLGDPSVGDDASNVRIALTCLLLSSVFLFNNASHPDRGSLQFLKCLATIRQRIPNSDDRQVFPTFLWIFRDFFLQLPTRRDTGVPYTLKEYMLERVLVNKGGGFSSLNSTEGEVVDSLLNDFAKLEVMSIGHPKRRGQQPLSPEDMANLGEMDWDDLDEGFQQDMEAVIAKSLECATPFQLGHSGEEAASPNKQKRWSLRPRKKPQSYYATGQAYAKWCQTVLELVNSNEIIPNLPDLQHQLLQQMADEQLQTSVGTFESELQEYMDSCPTFNNTEGADQNELVSKHDLQPIANESDLHSHAQAIHSRLRQELYRSSITSVAILTTTIKQLKSQCMGDEPSDQKVKANSKKVPFAGSIKTVSTRLMGGNSPLPASSIYSAIRTENDSRSESACRVLATSLYGPIQVSIRDDPTSLSVQEFEGVVEQLQVSYHLQARGPAKDIILMSHLLQPGDADALFIAKVTEKNDELQESLRLQDSLSKDMTFKEAELQTMSHNLEELKMKMEQELKSLEKSHENKLQKTLKEQEQRERKHMEDLKADMERQLKEAQDKAANDRKEREREFDMVQQQAQKRLESEIKAREERLAEEQKMFEEQIESLRVSADVQLQEQLAQAEAKRRGEEERLEREMQQKLHQAEQHLQEEVTQKESQLLKANQELEAKEKEQQDLKKKIEIAENRNLCADICCCM